MVTFCKTSGQITSSPRIMKKTLKKMYLSMFFYTLLGPAYFCSAELCVSEELSPATAFHIQTSARVDSTTRPFCLEASSFQENAFLKINLCNETSWKQMWYKDIYGQIRLENNVPNPDLHCIKWQKGNQLLMSPYCKSDLYNQFFNSKIYKFHFDFGDTACDDPYNHGQKENAIFVVKASAKKFFLGIDTDLSVELIAETSNIPTWKLKWVIYESQEPSTEPSSKPSVSQKPSFQPTKTPSALPSADPSPSPSTKPSPSPTLSQTPSFQPSLFPSDGPSLQPSLFPSDEPSTLPSDEVCSSLRTLARQIFTFHASPLTQIPTCYQ